MDFAKRARDSHGGRESGPHGRTLSEAALAKLFVAPSVLMLALVALFPVLYAGSLSLYLYDGREREGFTGLANYAHALSDERFWQAILATFTFTGSSVTLELLIGLGFALVMAQAFRGQGPTRAVILVPWVIPTVVAAQMWYFMFNIQPGFINHSLPLVPRDFNWLGQKGWTMSALIVADVWKTAPFMALLLLAGLQVIPPELYESARVDGASAWRRFLRITLPILRPTILVALLFRTVDALRVYDLPKVMTNGTFGTETLSMLVERYVVQTVNPGIASALAVITFATVLSVSIIFVSFLSKNLLLGSRA